MEILNSLKEYFTSNTPLLTAIISGFVSWLVAWYKSRAEIKNLLASYNREDEVAMRDTFAKLVRAVDEYKLCGYDYQKTNIYEHLAKLRPLTSSDYHKIFDNLRFSVETDNITSVNECMRVLDKIYSLHIQESESNTRNKKKQLIK